MKQVLINVGLSAIIGSILASIVIIPLDGFNFYFAGSAALLFFILISFYSDGGENFSFNLTSSWSTKALKIKKVVGDVLAAILLIACFLFLFLLFYMASK